MSIYPACGNDIEGQMARPYRALQCQTCRAEHMWQRLVDYDAAQAAHEQAQRPIKGTPEEIRERGQKAKRDLGW